LPRRGFPWGRHLGWPRQPTGFGTELTGTLPDDSATSAFTFSLVGPAFIGLDTLTNSAHRWTLRNRDRVLVNNEFVTDADWNARSYRHFLAESGEYQLVIRGGGDFRVRLVRADDAPLIPLNTDVEVVNGPGISSQFRRFHGTAGERIQYLGGD
jgi:hypothetical protein